MQEATDTKNRIVIVVPGQKKSISVSVVGILHQLKNNTAVEFNRNGDFFGVVKTFHAVYDTFAYMNGHFYGSLKEHAERQGIQEDKLIACRFVGSALECVHYTVATERPALVTEVTIVNRKPVFRVKRKITHITFSELKRIEAVK